MNKSPKLFLTKKDNIFVEDTTSVKSYSADNFCGNKLTVFINPSKVKQQIYGFGAALSGSSCYNLYTMSEQQREKALSDLFSREKGIGLNITRQAIGVTDFAYEYYTYDDIPEGETDFELEHFSIEKDKEYIIPQIKRAQQLHPDLKVCGGVWSPPLWMKTLYEWDTVHCAVLRPDCYDVFARYLVKAMKAYEAEGIHFDFITVQNEPFGKHPIPACFYDREMIAELINEYVIPTFKKEGVTTKVFAYDFNLWTDTIINYIKPTKDTVDGIAMHFYYSDVKQFKAVQNTTNYYTDLPLYITECGSPYERKYDDVLDPVLATTRDMCLSLRYGAGAYIRWNYVLDHKGGPSDPKNRNFVCEGILTYNTDEDKVYYGSGYYAMQHFSRFIKPDAHQIDSTDLNADDKYEHYSFAAKNPDGSIVAVVANATEEEKVYKLVLENTVYEYTMAPKSVATIIF